MSEPKITPVAVLGHAFDVKLAALRADPAFWEQSLIGSSGQLLTAVVSTLPVVRAELWQCEADRLHGLCCIAADGTTIAAGDCITAPDYAMALTRLQTFTTANPADPFDLDMPVNGQAAIAHLPIGIGGAPWGVLVLSHAEGCWSELDLYRAAGSADLLAQRLQLERTQLAENRFLALAENAPVAILHLDANRKVLYANQRQEELIGRAASSWTPEFWSTFITLEDGHEFNLDKEAFRRNGVLETNYRITRPDGSVRHALGTVASIQPTPDTTMASYLGVALDITALWEAQQALREQAERQRAILNYAAHAIVSMDLQGCITLFNPAAERLLGYRAEEVLGRHSQMLHVEAELEVYRQELRLQNLIGSAGVVAKALRDGVHEREWTLVRKDGSLVSTMTAVTVLQGEGDKPSGLMNIITDLTERRRLATLEQREQSLISHISRGTSAVVGEQFFDQLVQELRKATEAHFANVLVLRRDQGALKGELLSTPSASIRAVGIIDFNNTVIEPVLREGRGLHLLNAMQDLPDEEDVNIFKLGEVIAEPLLASDGTVLGALMVAHQGRLPEPELAAHLLDIFAVRAGTELERLQNERALRAREAEQHWLYMASEQIHAQQDVDSVARAVAAAGARHRSVPPMVTVTLSDIGAKSYRILAYAGPPERAPTQTVYPRTQGFDSRTLPFHNSIRLIPNFRAAMEGTSLHEETVIRGHCAVAVIALIERGQDIGTISFEYDDPAALDNLDLDTLATFGRSATLALARVLNREALQHQAEHDSLTGLYNRTVLHREFDQWQADGGQTTALLLLDLDRFKEVNDTFGHHVGDALLCQIGERLRTGLNHRHATLVRLGGDEFAVFLRDTSIGEARARIIANNLLQALRLPFVVEDAPLEISASIGVALYPEHGADSHALLRSADVAMYKAKQNGGGVTLYDHQFDFNTPERLALITNFNRGLRNNELRLFYQPKVDLRTRQVVGFEALIRWQHPQLGLLAPDLFLPVVEMTDAIHALTQTVLEIACAQLQRWIKAGEPWSVAVNLSARNLIDDRILHYIAGLLRRHQIPAGRLELEITETALIQDPGHALELLRQIAALGVTLSIDDFGTGYSSLAYLRDMPITTLKIDRTFVRDLLTNPQDQLIARSIIQLAQSLELNVIAEGVETAEVLARLQVMGCDQAQGYYFSRPLPLPELQLWLAQWRDGTLRLGNSFGGSERATQ